MTKTQGQIDIFPYRGIHFLYGCAFTIPASSFPSVPVDAGTAVKFCNAILVPIIFTLMA